ncbi:2-aminoethylphosphonate--pyruvate transaminase [Metabacillus idriensis]|uniref:2-aminoethylphosphonate--pyruvate transaminase n=1 Tax=Metabacillus idriensis TaxID=324768 RepID=A0A6I2MEY9_9BACI|nr:2-aminoethylphosphonate--pyruvate transaminase [Metabacillus idriensis]MCM3598378.1 2-aminoethylphosphonate--pyruvate transaminase [Metabacillus idriensis]MRX55001.1 2-aminoethylphosphonate--pyruvate transaminase [Metabacillus idriensis]
MNNPYLLLTPGPLSTSKTVRESMLKDWCTWDKDYNAIVQDIRMRLTALAAPGSEEYTAVLMQGSGTFSVESVISSVIPKENGKLLVACNGAYGERIADMAVILGIPTIIYRSDEQTVLDIESIQELLETHKDLTHLAVVHCETTTGMLNPIEDISRLAKEHGLITIVDAMSSFGGIPIDVSALKIDYLISSANKCIQGVPGFGFIIAKKEELAACKGNARSLSLDLYDQFETMEKHNGKWRFTSPTHVVRAFFQALVELEEEGGVLARYERYKENQHRLVEGMQSMGFAPLLNQENQSPIITAFLYPKGASFTFEGFYEALKQKGFVIYPGKISKLDTFRIGNIGEVFPEDIDRLLTAIKETSSEGAVKL